MKFEDIDTLTDLLLQYVSPYGREVNETLVQFYFNPLAEYAIEDIRRAFEKHVRDPAEGKFWPSPAHLMAYLPKKPDGHPEPMVAASLCPRSEHQAVFWTEPTKIAYFIHLYPAQQAGKSVDAAMPFFIREYKELVQQARDRGDPVKVTFSPGTGGPAESVRALHAAVKAGIVTVEWAQRWMQVALPGHPAVDLLPAPEKKALTHAA
jgi:hypothetical protein